MWKYLSVLLLSLVRLPVAAQDTDFADRTYALFVPHSYVEGQPAPLLLVLHGAGGSGARTRGWLGLDALAEEAGFIVAYPDGIAHDWDSGAMIPTENGPISVDDVGFLVWLVDEIGRTYTIDRNHVFAAGMSNGALMTYRLACRAPDTFSAIAAVAAPLYIPVAVGCSDQPPVSVLFIHGTADHILPWDRVRLSDGRLFGLSVFDTFDFWAKRNRCSPDPAAIQAEELPDLDSTDGSTLRHLALVDCAEGTQVQFYGVDGGGHTWPGRKFDVDLDLGPLNMDIDASQLILDWLAGLPVRSDATPSAEATPAG